MYWTRTRKSEARRLPRLPGWVSSGHPLLSRTGPVYKRRNPRSGELGVQGSSFEKCTSERRTTLRVFVGERSIVSDDLGGPRYGSCSNGLRLIRLFRDLLLFFTFTKL